MAFMLAKKFILCSVYSLLVSLVEPKVTCPQNSDLPSVNERAQRLAEDG